MSPGSPAPRPCDWRAQLIADHPRLFPGARTGPDHAGPGAGAEAAETPQAGWAEVPDGWAGVLATACARLDAVLARAGPHARIAITGAREKYGGLRLDLVTGGLGAAGEAVAELAVDLAEARSAQTCAVCGRRGRPCERGGWIAALCEAHADGHAPAPGDPGLQVSARLVGGRVVRTARRYRFDIDAFVPAPVPPEE